MWDFHFEAADRILGKECSSEPILPQLGNHQLPLVMLLSGESRELVSEE